MHRAARIISFGFLLAASVALAEDTGDRAKANKADLEKLQGRWKVTGLVVRGQDVDDFVKLAVKFKFKDEALTVTGDAEGFAEQNRVIRIDANTTPKLIDFAETAKALEEKKDIVESVYSLDGDSLVICFNLDGSQPAKGNRPATVESKPDSSAALIKLERIKE